MLRCCWSEIRSPNKYSPPCTFTVGPFEINHNYEGSEIHDLLVIPLMAYRICHTSHIVI